jgi:uncharacterized protein YceK
VRRLLFFALTLTLSIAGTGCATALNMQDDSMRKPYGGVTMPVAEFFGGGESAEYSSLLFWPIWLFDKPLSLFADTLTLPFTLSAQRDSQSPAKNQTPAPPSF